MPAAHGRNERWETAYDFLLIDIRSRLVGYEILLLGGGKGDLTNLCYRNGRVTTDAEIHY